MTPDDRWVPVAEEKDLDARSRVSVKADGLSLLLLKQSGQVFAVSNRCPHLGCPLTRGGLEDYVLTCPCHDWTFDIRTGEFMAAREIKLATYDCKTESGKVYIKI